MARDRLDYIAKPIWRWLVSVPLGFIAGYNVVRAEVYPNWIPLGGVLSEWRWEIWLLLSLLTVALIIIEGLWRYDKSNKPSSFPVGSHNQVVIVSGGGSIVNSPITQNQFVSFGDPFLEGESFPDYKFRSWILASAYGVSINVLNDSDFDMVDCSAELVAVMWEGEKDFTPINGNLLWLRDWVPDGTRRTIPSKGSAYFRLMDKHGFLLENNVSIKFKEGKHIASIFIVGSQRGKKPFEFKICVSNRLAKKDSKIESEFTPCPKAR